MVYSAGAALDWLRRTFRVGGFDAFARMAGSREGAGGVTFPLRCWWRHSHC
jgi:hypothetical protein